MRKIFGNKKIMVSILTLISIVVISIAFVMNKNYQNRQLLLNEIASYSTKFENESDRNVKLSIFNDLVSNEAKYSKNLKENYNETLLDMKNWFKDDYNNTINENTINDLENSSDKEAINNRKTNLENLKNTMNNEKVLDEKDLSECINSIDSLIKSYDARLNAIIEAEKKAEEERLAREEAERLAKEEAERIAKEQAEAEAKAAQKKQAEAKAKTAKKEQHQSSNSVGSNSNSNHVDSGSSNNKNSSQNSGGSRSSGSSGGDQSSKSSGKSSSSGKNWNDGYLHTWSLDPDTGEKIEGSDTYVDGEGNVYDGNGNFLYDLNDWLDSF